ncbi:type VI secretion system protein TssL, short form [Acerihabitans sp. TG2]|uniref:type VI secretion system protein TssL, short form n=1 Tax=Acerihabitans sp. TG2 TaxID=3096008 RepID=UPI002B23EE2B|nr:type VI secretion system protein TssL, short form [Acerihabitans sp. TG2]MEA9392319.1 type VI secretion system protein TssL, short form [Acerihabitans sp. TG2]
MDSIADNPVDLIDTLLQDTWLFVLQVKNDPSAFVSEATYHQAITRVENVRTALNERGIEARHIDAITYAQCALLDETVLTRLNPGMHGKDSKINLAWHALPLQARFFSTLNAGTEVVERINALLREPAPDRGVLTCYQRVLSLGFHGRFSENSPERQALLDSLNALVPAFEHPLPTPIMVHYRPHARNTLLHSRVLWIVLSVLVTVGLFVGLQLSLQQLLPLALPG